MGANSCDANCQKVPTSSLEKHLKHWHFKIKCADFPETKKKAFLNAAFGPATSSISGFFPGRGRAIRTQAKAETGTHRDEKGVKWHAIVVAGSI